MIRDYIQKILKDALSSQSWTGEIEIDRPPSLDMGDYASPIALKLSKQLKQSPLSIAEKLVKNIKDPQAFFSKVAVISPGFINFWLSDLFLYQFLSKSLQPDNQFKSTLYAQKKVMVEYTDPNPFKEFHIGHLFSNTVGEAIARMYEQLGAKVKRANYQGDIGMHVAKSIWGIQHELADTQQTISQVEKLPLSERSQFLGRSYTKGSRAFEENEQIKKEITEINRQIYAHNPSVMNIYEKGRSWSLEAFENIYKKLGTKFDLYYFESQVADQGIKLVQKHIDDSIFEKSNGAIVFNGKQYGLHTRVFINSLGLPTYEAKDLALAPKKYHDFPYDVSLIITGTEVKDYFKVILKTLELIDPKLGLRTKHITHGMVRLPSGKMSSRHGNIITGTALLSLVSDKISEHMKKNSRISSELFTSVCEAISVGAIKYSLLKTNIGKDVVFDLDESISFDGDSGPYIQYTASRCSSILSSLSISDLTFSKPSILEKEEKTLLRELSQFPSVLSRATEKLAPNYICSSLHSIAQLFNLFYHTHSVIHSDTDKKSFRIAVVKATEKILNTGLTVLGIQPVSSM